jgi:hypothetical protein
MKDKVQIQREVDKALESLDGIQRAQANPYLFTRVKAALQNEESGAWGQAIQFMGRPVVAIATIVLILIINMAVFFSVRSESSDEDQQLYANEYFSNSTMSDYENATNQ